MRMSAVLFLASDSLLCWSFHLRPARVKEIFLSRRSAHWESVRGEQLRRRIEKKVGQGVISKTTPQPVG
jgi:hypothetical protein